MAFSPLEIEAVEKMLPTMGQYVAESGIGTKSFNDCSRDEILGLFASTVRTFRKEFQEVIDREGIPY